MSESATSRDERNAATVRRIVAAARRLTVERGLDGFTMDDLAEATGVSRRTLFNHVAGKDDAALGPLPELPEEALATFVAGGPHGHLLEDVVALAVRVIDEVPETPEEVAAGRAALDASPRLHQLSARRLHELVESSVDLVAQREGAAYDRERLDVAIALVIACVDLAMTRYLTGAHGDDLGQVLLETVATARDLFS